MERPESVARKLVSRTGIWLVINAALLFIPAGSLRWPEAWIYLALIGGIGLWSGFIIAKHDPALLRERMRSPVQRDQKGWDKILTSALFVLWLTQYVVASLDAVRFRTSDMPAWLEVVGAAGVAFGLYVFHIVVRANTFAAPVVKIQHERKHHVISTGPYAYVRHPMYSGAVVLIFGTGLLLGSWYAVALGVVITGLLACRAVLEEQTLKRELEGYAAYAAHRLVPGVW